MVLVGIKQIKLLIQELKNNKYIDITKKNKDNISDKIKKLEEAKRLLATTTYSMKEIAVKLKYKSHTHFGMDFKNNTGMTPAEYRKAIKAKREKQMNTKDYQMNLKDYLAKMC